MIDFWQVKPMIKQLSHLLPAALLIGAFCTSAAAKMPAWFAPRRNANSKVIPVWPHLKVPMSQRTRKLHKWPTLTEYMADRHHANGCAVVICPGGGYVYEAVHHEGYAIAQWLNKFGVSAFVLNYRLPDGKLPPSGVPWPLQDVRRAVQIVRAHAHKWHINPNDVGVAGFSAGGHVAAMAGTLFLPGNPESPHRLDRYSTRPDFLILGYPVISMIPGITHPGSHNALLGKHCPLDVEKYFSTNLMVSQLTPPTFICVARNDTVVPLANSFSFYHALKRDHIPAVLHVYATGEHGFGLGVPGTASTRWPAACIRWMQKMGFINR
jgi:acetyl esterase/lipase